MSIRSRLEVKAPESMSAAVGKGVRRAVGTVASFALVGGATLAGVQAGLIPQVMTFDHPSTILLSPEQAFAARVQQDQADAARALIIRHGCWTAGQEVPADMVGKVPGRVVTSMGDAWPTLNRGVHAALEQELHGERTPGLTVYAFCP